MSKKKKPPKTKLSEMTEEQREEIREKLIGMKPSDAQKLMDTIETK